MLEEALEHLVTGIVDHKDDVAVRRKELAQFGSKLESIHARIFSRRKDKARRDLWSRRAALPFGPWTGAGRG